MSKPASNANIARHLTAMAAARPAAPALKVPRGRDSGGRIDYLTLTFAELDQQAAAWRERIVVQGIKPGDRTLVMVKPGLPLIAIVFALFQNGSVPVVIDPGMGRRNFLECVRRSKPRALVGIWPAIVMSHVWRGAFRDVAHRLRVPSSTLAVLPPPTGQRRGVHWARPLDLAAILFTSGSTGAPKGVRYEHGMFEAQVRLIRSTYGIEPGEIDLPMLPIFALFNPALGMLTVVPEIDPKRPASADPAAIVQAIQQENVTNSFGSPTLWNKVADFCGEKGISLPSMKRVLSAGAPVPASLWSKARTFLPNGTLHSPYGATEALPIASISASEVDAASLEGACVGRVVDEMEVRIIAVTDGPVPALTMENTLPRNVVGEIIVRGPVVTREYDALPEATAMAKIKDRNHPDAVWHRMGDCGFIDDAGRLWFVGRKAERVTTPQGTLHTEPCERIFRQDGRVKRCALIGLGSKGDQIPALVVETGETDRAALQRFANELADLGKSLPASAPIERFYFHPGFPVDVRHNAKIHRLTLARWAATATPVKPGVGR